VTDVTQVDADLVCNPLFLSALAKSPLTTGGSGV